MKKLKHVEIFESFINEGVDSNPPLPPVDISNSSDVIAVYFTDGDGVPIIGLLSPSEARKFKSFLSGNDLLDDGHLNFYTKPGVAYVGLTPYYGFEDDTEPILAGPDYEPAADLYFALGGYGTDYGGSEPEEAGAAIYGKYNYFGSDISDRETLDDPSHPARVAHVKHDPEAAGLPLRGRGEEDFSDRMSGSHIVTLKRGYLTVFGGPGTQGDGTNSKTLPFKEALEEIKDNYMDYNA